ncbi:MAG TPA: hypothetical protein VHL34_24140 [Rhizomicrobium sp.]|nr:hypothetical protein [Rhizomicrobium sp.]
MSTITIASQFKGPPMSGNGGYVSGMLARELGGIATVALRAIIPLDTPLNLKRTTDGATLTGDDGKLIAEAKSASADALPAPPPPPTLEQAQTGSAQYLQAELARERPFHPPCFTCSVLRGDGDALRVFTGPYGGEPGHIAAAWTPHAAFADADGLAPTEIVWAAMDCPGSFAWLDKLGHTGGLLGTMTAEILRRPAIGQSHLITAWPIEQSGRKYISGVALFSAGGELMARGHQIWIGRAG